MAQIGDKCPVCGARYTNELMTGGIIIFHRQGCTGKKRKKAMKQAGGLA